MTWKSLAILAAAPLALGADQPPSAASSPAESMASRSVTIEIDRGKGFERWCGGLLVQPRDPTASRRVLTASHCIFNMAGADYDGARLRARLDGDELVSIDRDAVLKDVKDWSPSTRRQAVAMDFAFIELAGDVRPTPIGAPSGIIPDRLSLTDKVFVRSGIGVHHCQVVSRCGTQSDVASCKPEIVETVSGSPAWVRRGDEWLVAGIVTRADQSRATLTSYSAVLAKNSFLSADPTHSDHDAARSEFVRRYLYQSKYRLPRDPDAPNCRRSRASLIDLDPTDIRESRVFVGGEFDAAGTLVTWDRAGKDLCRIASAGLMDCAKLEIEGHGHQLLRGVTALGSGIWLIRFDGGGALLVGFDEGIKGWNRIASIQAASDGASSSEISDTAITGTVEGGLRTSSGALMLFGESGLCIVENSACRLVRRPPDKDQAGAHFTVRDAKEISPGRILAVGRDFPQRAQCALLELSPQQVWQITRFCGGLDPAKFDYRGINAILGYDKGALLFTSSGAIMSIGANLVARRVQLRGLLVSAIGAPNEFDDAIRVARWVERDRLLAVAGSDGGFHLLTVSRASDDNIQLASAACLSRFDLGLWILSMDAHPEKAVVLTQAGELLHLRWKHAELDRYVSSGLGTLCRG